MSIDSANLSAREEEFGAHIDSKEVSAVGPRKPGSGPIISFTLETEGIVSPVSMGRGRKAQATPANAPVHILLVDDNRLNQIVASKFLTSLGMTADIANNGKEAVELALGKPYDLVLMDIEMPVMDGYQATETIRSMNKSYFKKVPIIALTASSMLGIRDKVMASGMNDFITKPFVPSDLETAIRRHLISTGENSYAAFYKAS